ncbi:hypothetical protein Ciccas_006617 [Cichlidogyrus casuarinus]|uniref:Uncharacterized protein n=1 Tax=Cichlidogyrus casuarinus TaxID=1844966 RepID=A0ABD2Q5Q6_9PLAT
MEAKVEFDESYSIKNSNGEHNVDVLDSGICGHSDFDRIKKERIKCALQAEKDFANSARIHSELINLANQKRNEHLSQLLHDDARQVDEINRLSDAKQLQRKQLIQSLKYEEESANRLIKELQINQEKNRKCEQAQDALEIQEQTAWLRSHERRSLQLRKQEILRKSFQCSYY